MADTDQERQGRFAALSKPMVTAATTIAYPVQPATSPWANDPLGQEPSRIG